MIKPAKWIDLLALIFSLIVIGGAAVWTLRSGVFSAATLSTDEKLAWHLTRSAGIGAYLLLCASMIWGLFVSGQHIKDWSPGTLSLTMHTTIAWLALVLGFTHALLLLGDSYFSYTLSDVLIPFRGPYRPLEVGLGTLALWLTLVVTLSFQVKRRIGHRAWRWLHLTSYGAFVMVTLHGLTAGTDSGLIGFRLLIGIAVVLVVLLLGMRMGKAQARPARR